MNRKIASLEEMDSFADEMLAAWRQKIAADVNEKALVVGLSGDLGSGKTAFSQAIAKNLGVSEQVTSPTFVIEKIYQTKDVEGFQTLIHIDAYRIEKPEEVDTFGLKEAMKMPHALVLIEWPEKIKQTLPTDIVEIKFTFIDEKTREVAYE
jgi:tRNA threonylcarbamoyladenosine biosynthesis protein TsaE